MSCSQTIARLLLVIINIVFFLLGLALLVVGCLVKFGSTLISDHIKPLLAQVDSGATSNLDLKTLFDGVAIGFIVLGAIIFVIGFLGCCGAMCKYKILICFYGVLVLIVIIGEIVCVALVLAMRTKVESTLKTALKDTIKNEYGGSKAKDSISIAWNYVFYELKCCGVDDYKDIHVATKWNRTISYGTLEAPYSCCTGVTGTFPDITLPASSNVSCAAVPTTTTSNYKKGCYAQFLALVQSNATITIAVGVSIVVVEIFCMVAAFCLYSAWKKEGVV